MDAKSFFLYLLVMAGTTYLVRAVPFALVKEKIRNPLIKSFLYYIPYAVLTAMTIPAIFSCTGSYISAVLGFTVAVILSLLGQGLMTVSMLACLTVFLSELLIR